MSDTNTTAAPVSGAPGERRGADSIVVIIVAVIAAALLSLFGGRYGKLIAPGGMLILFFTILITDTRLSILFFALSMPFMTTDIVTSVLRKPAGPGIQPLLMMAIIVTGSLFLRAASKAEMVKLPRSPVHIAAFVMTGVVFASVFPWLLFPPEGMTPVHFLKYVNMSIYLLAAIFVYLVMCASIQTRGTYIMFFLALLVITDLICIYGIFRAAATMYPALKELDVLKPFVDNNPAYTIGEGGTKISGIIFPRLRSTFYEPGGLGDYLLIVLPTLLNMVLSPQRVPRKWRGFILFSLILTSTVFLLAVARAAMIGLVFGLAVLFFLEFVRGGFGAKMMRVAFYLGIVAVIVAGISYGLFKDPGTVFREAINQRMTTIDFNQTDLSTVSRMSTMKKAGIDFYKSPIYGLGYTIGGFYSLPQQNIDNTWMVERSILTVTLGESGLIGALVCLIFFAAVFHDGISGYLRSAKDPVLGLIAPGLLASFISMAAARFIGLEFHSLTFWALIGLMVCLKGIVSGSAPKGEDAVAPQSAA